MSNRIRKAVIPAAGLGTRFLPVTKAVPKEMLPIIDQPMIQYVVQEAVSSGCDQVVLVTARNKTAIEDYFDYRPELEDHLLKQGKSELAASLKKIAESCEIITVRQKNPKGLGHAVWTAAPIVGQEDFAVLLGDDLMVNSANEAPATRQIVDVFHASGKNIVGVMNVPKTETQKYGIVATREYSGPGASAKTWSVSGVVEKPRPENAPSTLAIPGRYVLGSKIFKILESVKPGQNGEIQLTDALEVLAKENNLLAHEFSGKRFDTGDRLGYIEATLFFALQRKELAPQVQTLLKKYSTGSV